MRPENRFSIELDHRYRYRMRAETIGQGTMLYSTKVWKDGGPEPAQWQMTEEDIKETLPAGAIAFVVHHSDVTPCRVRVTSNSSTTGAESSHLSVAIFRLAKARTLQLLTTAIST